MDILAVDNLSISFKTFDGIYQAIEKINFSLKKGEILGIVGETGCGKSVTARAIMNLLPENNTLISSGNIYYKNSELHSSVIEILNSIINSNRKVMFIRDDNAGENISFKKECEKYHLGIKFEYTSRSTPQHNGVVERKYQTLYNSLRSTMNEAGFEDKMRCDL